MNKLPHISAEQEEGEYWNRWIILQSKLEFWTVYLEQRLCQSLHAKIDQELTTGQIKSITILYLYYVHYLIIDPKSVRFFLPLSIQHKFDLNMDFYLLVYQQLWQQPLQATRDNNWQMVGTLPCIILLNVCLKIKEIKTNKYD